MGHGMVWCGVGPPQLIFQDGLPAHLAHVAPFFTCARCWHHRHPAPNTPRAGALQAPGPRSLATPTLRPLWHALLSSTRCAAW